jgi:transcriptional regulator with XRE-family HTH domain
MAHLLYKKLKEERKKRNLSIKHLSERSYVSSGMISSIERGLVNPSVDILSKLCKALGMAFDDFLPSKYSSHNPFILKRKEQYCMTDDNGYSYISCPNFERDGHSVLITYINPGKKYGRMHISPGINELIVVIEGSAIFYYDDDQFPMEKGDSAYFSADKIHYLMNKTDSEVIVCWCVFTSM